MADKFQDKYRIPSARLQSWNYRWNAIYFITICTRNHVAYFGEIKSSNMILSETGEIATNFLLEIPGRYSYARLDEYVIMPNHVHMIIVIDKGHDGLDGADVKNRDAMNRRDAINQFKLISRMNRIAAISIKIGKYDGYDPGSGFTCLGKSRETIPIS